VKLLLLDQDAKALSLVLRAAQAGHTVKWYAPDTEVGNGFRGFERVDNWVAHTGWADLIFNCGCDKFEPKLRQLVQRGYPVWNTPCSMKFEDYATLTPATEQFTTVDALVKHLYAKPARYVLKGEDVDTYESHSAADMLAHVRSMPTPEGNLLLQDYVEGLQATVLRHMGRDGWLGPVQESLSHTGISRWVEDSPLFDNTLGTLTDLLMQRGLRGTAMAKCCISADGEVFVFKVKCRWAVQSTAQPTNDPVQWALDALSAKDTATYRTEDMAYYVKIEAEEPGAPVYGITRGVAVHTQPMMVQLRRMPDMNADGTAIVERDLWVSAGEYPLAVDGYGTSAKQAMRRAMSTLDKIYSAEAEPDIEDEYFSGLRDKLSAAQSAGFLTALKYD
jgi:hypothetical protein